MDGFSVRVKVFFPPFYFLTVFSFILLLILTAVYILHVPPVRLSVVTGLPIAGLVVFSVFDKKRLRCRRRDRMM